MQRRDIRGSVDRSQAPAVARPPGPTAETAFAPPALNAAWRRVQANGGGPGGDGETIAVFAARLHPPIATLPGALVPLRDRRMSDASFAYRPGRSVAQALAAARAEVARGRRVVVDADIARFFDNVPHGPLLAELGIWLDDPRLIAVIALWLRSF